MRTRFSSKQIGRQADDGSISGALRPNGRPDVGILCATAAGHRAELCAATGSARRRKFARGLWMAGGGGGATSVAAARLDTQRPGKAVSESALSAAGHSHGLGARKEQGKRRRGRPSRAPSAAALVRQARRTRTSTEPLRRGDSFSRPRDFFPRSFPTPELRSDNHFVLSVTDDERRRRLLLPPIVLDADGDIEHQQASPTTRGPAPESHPHLIFPGFRALSGILFALVPSTSLSTL